MVWLRIACARLHIPATVFLIIKYSLSFNFFSFLLRMCFTKNKFKHIWNLLMRWVFQVQHETYSVLAVISFFAFNWLNIKLATWFLVYWTFAEMQIKKKKKHNQCNGCTRGLQICFCLPIWKMWISWIFCIKKSKNIKYFF